MTACTLPSPCATHTPRADPSMPLSQMEGDAWIPTLTKRDSNLPDVLWVSTTSDPGGVAVIQMSIPVVTNLLKPEITMQVKISARGCYPFCLAPLRPSPAGRAAGSRYTHPGSACRSGRGNAQTPPWPAGCRPPWRPSLGSNIKTYWDRSWWTIFNIQDLFLGSAAVAIKKDNNNTGRDPCKHNPSQ